MFVFVCSHVGPSVKLLSPNMLHHGTLLTSVSVIRNLEHVKLPMEL